MKNDQIPKSILEPTAFLDYLAPAARIEMQAARSALLCFDTRNFRAMKETITGKKIRGLSCDTWLTDTGTAICGRMGIGAPAAVSVLEELIACGIKKAIAFGTAGTLALDLEPGSLVVCTEAFSDEGTSGHYFPGSGSGKPSSRLLKEMTGFLESRGTGFRKGRSWTTDAPFRETPEKLEHFTGKGALVVEMEACALYNVARFREIEVLSVFIIGDSIAGGSWKPYFHSERIISRLNEISKLMLEFI